jgi:hypothetical protein
MDLMHPLDGVHSVLELGAKRRGAFVYKTWFEDNGYRHVSVDWNGESGALTLDLRRPLGLGRFDLVTNFGTTEHVDDQAPVWRNICEAAATLFVSTTPAPESRGAHGLWYPSGDFYRALAELNGFVVERLFLLERQRKHAAWCARLRRVCETDFVMPPAELLHRRATRDKWTARAPA